MQQIPGDSLTCEPQGDGHRERLWWPFRVRFPWPVRKPEMVVRESETGAYEGVVALPI